MSSKTGVLCVKSVGLLGPLPIAVDGHVITLFYLRFCPSIDTSFYCVAASSQVNSPMRRQRLQALHSYISNHSLFTSSSIPTRRDRSLSVEQIHQWRGWRPRVRVYPLNPDSEVTHPFRPAGHVKKLVTVLCIHSTLPIGSYKRGHA